MTPRGMTQPRKPPHRAPDFGRLDVPAVLADLPQRTVNFRPDEVGGPAWNQDSHRVRLTPESPGEPEPRGSWRTACQLVADYDFCPPEILRAAFHPTEPLLGRNMLLEGRFSALRLYVPVRVTDVIDERRAPDLRVWGFRYATLDGHLERGDLTYEVTKHERSGHVEFAVSAQSQRAPTLGAVLSLGWAVFGRRRQLLFYRRCGERMQELTRTSAPRELPGTTFPEQLRFAPDDARATWVDRVSLHRTDPG